jgi:flagellar biosynthesis/type III secretory pathway M-ring protein FliF/YscJ
MVIIMQNKNIPALITLCAGAIASITCIVNNYPLLDTLLIVFLILIVFYVIGLIIGKVIGKINKNANDAYVRKEQERMEAEQEAIKALNEQEAIRALNEQEAQEDTTNDSITSTNDI